MLTGLKAALGSLLGAKDGGAAGSAGPAVEYKGCRIIPAPYKDEGQFRVAGTIEKDTDGGVKRHEFVRADTYASWDDAVAFTTAKAKQIIDLQGDRIFT